jgi:hypothetical protein
MTLKAISQWFEFPPDPVEKFAAFPIVIRQLHIQRSDS